MPKNLMDLQLKETSQLTGACWAVWLGCGNDLEILASYKINLKQRETFLNVLRKPALKSWLNGALTGKRNRSHSVSLDINLPAKKLYIFPDPVTQRVIAVGANFLSEAAKRFWRVVAMGNSGRSFLDTTDNTGLLNIEVFPYHLPSALDRILNILMRAAVCEGGWLAIRSGDYFEIKVFSNCPDCKDARISIEANPFLRELMHTRQQRHIKMGEADWPMIPRIGFSETTRAFIVLPLVIGQRLIGLVALWNGTLFQPAEIEKLEQLAKRIAPSVEGSVTFSDLSNHLHRMALLNDFALTIASSLDLDQIVQRMFALLRRAFNTERINLMVIASDGASVQNYFDREGSIISEATIHVAVPQQIEKGDVYRTDLILPGSSFQAIYPGSHSALIVPLKYRKHVIGLVGLESIKDGAFTVYDEHLLVVIASYLAGLLENSRLRQEAEGRARNISLIHEVVERVIGLRDVREVAQIAAELMAKNFDYELAGVALVMGKKNELQVAGIGGKAAGLVHRGLAYIEASQGDGIVKRVAITGESVLVNNVTDDPIYIPIPEWDAGSEMCVALKDGDRILGVVDVECQRKNAFTQNDLLLLESLASILASVISSAGQYQKLEAIVDQLRTTRQELQERIVAQRTAESRLIQAAKLAAVGEMAAGIAHELNNPLTTISGFTELTLETLPDGSTSRADLELVLREAHRARDVVHRLLDFARQSESVRIRSDLNEIVEDVLALVNHLLHTSGIRIIEALRPDIPSVSMDRNQIKQVILNLIHNAIHAMPGGGELQISTDRFNRDQRDWLMLKVRDTGTGISPENLERIFEPFFTTRAKDGGTGLGLSVSYGIIADHGGYIEAESQVGEGSTFIVWLPIEISDD